MPASELDPYLTGLRSLADHVSSLADSASTLTHRVPGSAVLLRYIKSSHQDDPFRTLLEILLVFFVIRTWRQSRTRGDGGGSHFIKFKPREVEELVAEWQPEPLMEPMGETVKELSRPPVILGPPGLRPTVVAGEAAQELMRTGDEAAAKEHGKQVLNLSGINFAGLLGHERIKRKAITQLHRSGVGSCGPPGFYGTFDVHMELERDIAAFLGTQSSIIYAQGFSTISSVIPAFSKRGDVIVADRGVNFAIQKGVQLSRSTIRWYDHNDVNSLERVLEGLRRDDIKYRRTLTRRFIVTEGLFENDGQICDLPRIIELKKKYKFRLILDETWSVGSLGKTGRGVTEHFDIPGAEIDMLIGSLANGFVSAGGFCAGSAEVVTHQRINSAALVFSAALPPLLATAASEAICILKDSPELMSTLRARTAVIRKTVDSISGVASPSHPASPLIHICLQPKTVIDGQTAIVDLPFEQAEAVLQDVVDAMVEKGLLLTRAMKVWEAEIDPMVPSLRICVSAGLTDEEARKAAEDLKTVLEAAVAKIQV